MKNIFAPRGIYRNGTCPPRRVSVKLARVQTAVSLDAPETKGVRRVKFRAGVRSSVPARADAALSALSALLLVLSFPDFNLWPLAWVGLVPLLVAVVRVERARQAFVLGWLAGALFFYGSCWWLTHSMIHYGGLPSPLAYALLVPVVIIVGLFPATFALVLARLLRGRWGVYALLAAPPLWAATEWARLGATGQLWNAIGYSQAFHPALIQTATWGGVYAVGFLILTTNSVAALLLLQRNVRAVGVGALVLMLAGLAFFLNTFSYLPNFKAEAKAGAVVVAVQPNVSPNFERTPEENALLVNRHLTMSAEALRAWEQKQDAEATREAAHSKPTASSADPPDDQPRVVIWPESPMNFAYARDEEFQELVGRFARTERTSVLFNSLEPAPAGGAYNSAVLVNEAGRLVAQYDKIRLLPFGEYVPLPRWFPPAWLVSGIVGDFTPGANYTLLPLGETRAGVFICFESAFPSIARQFTDAGADVLINISNDGYLGQTPVLRQHLANAVFRAVENRRTVLRVTNTGISARITPRGEVLDATGSFQPAV
ncbi:MAG TPA: apolipoprotein N-acyltransferase, partial [Pyrinomonadaceae bacterium]|nr:apolipoprotein N-acyltransferase [Pyrinomonadaceae bacterium]